MVMRVLAAAALGAGTLVALGAPALGQAYPPPVRSITVSDATPAAGQSVQVTLRTCTPGTRALFGLDLVLLGSARVGADGVAVATVRIPRREPTGRHVVVGVCVAPDGTPLVLHTDVTVTAAAAPGGTAAPPPPASPPPSTPPPPPMPGLGTLGSAGGPADPTGLFAQAGAAAGVPADLAAAAPADPAPAPGASTGAGAPTAGSGSAPAGAATTSTTKAAAGDDPSGWATAGRVALGLAALGGVPVAMAFNRGPRATTRRRFA